MSKANSNSITKLGVANKLQAEDNKKKIAALEVDNTKEKNAVLNLKNKEAIENKKLQTQIGTTDSSIKKINSVDKTQLSTNTKLSNEDKSEEAGHKALEKAEAAESKTESANQKADVEAQETETAAHVKLAGTVKTNDDA